MTSPTFVATVGLLGMLPVATTLGGNDSMAVGANGYSVSAPLLTIGETLSGTTGALNSSTAGDYTPVGILDGLGAYELDSNTVRVFANHELLNFRGNAYTVSDGQGGSFTLNGARVSYFDIDKNSRQITDGGVAYERIYDADAVVASDVSFLQNGFAGFSRFCSGQLFEGGTYGLEDTIYFTGEEDGGAFNPLGGAEWALDVATGDLWQVPYMGRGAWENITAIETGLPGTVAFVLADDSSPFDFDGDGVNENAPLYLYVGRKDPDGNFLERNGLGFGFLYVFRANAGQSTPSDFNGSTPGSGEIKGTWLQVNNQRSATPSIDGSNGFDPFGFPTQANLWLQARDLGAFGFSRPEDVATNPADGSEIVLASTGVDTFEIDPATGNGVDTFGTIYGVKTRFHPNKISKKIRATLSILYDGDADPTRALRSPDNLDWADDGFIYVQEDRAEFDTASGDEILFGPTAVNPNEAGIVRLDPSNGSTLRVANIDRSVVLDGSLADPTQAVDVDAGDTGAWETSGILDVSTLFGEDPGTLFLFDVQAHGIEDQDNVNPSSRINDGDLVEGGQLLFLSKD